MIILLRSWSVNWCSSPSYGVPLMCANRWSRRWVWKCLLNFRLALYKSNWAKTCLECMIISVFIEPFCEVSGKGSPLGHPIGLDKFVLAIFPFLWVGFGLGFFGCGWNPCLNQAPEQFNIELYAAFFVGDLSNEAAIPVG